jgi:hypothetical protein
MRTMRVCGPRSQSQASSLCDSGALERGKVRVLPFFGLTH